MFYTDKLLRNKHFVYMKILIKFHLFSLKKISKMNTEIFFSLEELHGLYFARWIRILDETNLMALKIVKKIGDYLKWTDYSESEHSYRPRNGAAAAACVGIRSIIDALLKPRQVNEPIGILLRS